MSGVFVWLCVYLQLSEDLLDVAVAALGDVHVLLVGGALEHRLRGVGEVLVEGEVGGHRLSLHLLALLGPDLAHVRLPARDHLRQG